MNFKVKNILKLSLLGLALIVVASCKKKSEGEKPCGWTDITFSNASQDVVLGQQVDSTILSTPAEYPILDPSKYPLVYQELEKIKNDFLNSGKIKHKDDFAWKLRVIQDDTTLNAFCTPGGYIYVYTGIIKYLPSLDALAGVMGHEMAHAELRHSSKAMTQQYGLDLLGSIILGQNKGKLAEIAASLKMLSYSRCHESEADIHSVDYLANSGGTSYQCDGTARFFEKIQESGGSNVPEFLSTHPDPGNRVQVIKDKAKSLNCNTNAYDADGSKIRAIANTLVY